MEVLVLVIVWPSLPFPVDNSKGTTAIVQSTHLEVDAASVHLLNSNISGGMIGKLNKAIVEATLVSKLSQIWSDRIEM